MVVRVHPAERLSKGDSKTKFIIIKSVELPHVKINRLKPFEIVKFIV